MHAMIDNRNKTTGKFSVLKGHWSKARNSWEGGNLTINIYL